MSNSMYDIDFTRALPLPLKNDKNMLALGRVVAAELQENIRLSRLCIIYARIDELEEDILDVLAYDLHVDWYDDSYPVEAKREVIKNSVRVHKRLGTKYAVVTALRSVFPYSEVEEWFEYNGTHHRYRIVLDLTDAKAPADLEQIIQTARFYKRMTAHLDEIIYQTQTVIEIAVEATAYRFRHGRTGRYAAGTQPRRNTRGGVADSAIDILAAAAASGYHSTPTGTKPYRNTGFINQNNGVSAETTAEAFLYAVNMTGKSTTGTEPRISTEGQFISGGIAPEVTAEGFSYNVRRCGTAKTKIK